MSFFVLFVDKQRCDLRFGSWTYDQQQMDFTYYSDDERHVGVKDYVPSGSWDLLDGPMTVRPASFNASTNDDNDTMVYKTNARLNKPNGRDRVEFICTLIIKRKTLFYTVNLIIPTVNNHENLFFIQIIFFRFSGAYFLFISLCFLFTYGCR